MYNQNCLIWHPVKGRSSINVVFANLEPVSRTKETTCSRIPKNDGGRNVFLEDSLPLGFTSTSKPLVLDHKHSVLNLSALQNS